MAHVYLNNQTSANIPKFLTGKDGALYDEDGNLLASMESYQSQVSVTNASVLPVGDAQEREILASFSVTLNFSEFVVEDERFFKGFSEALKTGVMPAWNFTGVLRRASDGREQRIVYRQCVPSGTIDMQNVTNDGSVIKRAWSMFVNEPPDVQSFL